MYWFNLLSSCFIKAAPLTSRAVPVHKWNNIHENQHTTPSTNKSAAFNVSMMLNLPVHTYFQMFIILNWQEHLLSKLLWYYFIYTTKAYNKDRGKRKNTIQEIRNFIKMMNTIYIHHAFPHTTEARMSISWYEEKPKHWKICGGKSTWFLCRLFTMQKRI